MVVVFDHRLIMSVEGSALGAGANRGLHDTIGGGLGVVGQAQQVAQFVDGYGGKVKLCVEGVVGKVIVLVVKDNIAMGDA